MAERESEHRRSLEESMVRAQMEQDRRDANEARRGQICALLITLGAIGAGAYTALQGHEAAGSIIGVGGITSIVASFLAGKAKQEEAATPQPQPKPNSGKSGKKKKR